MLVVWVFALVAGIANACPLHDRQSSHDGQGHASSAEALVDPDGHASTCKDSWDAGPSNIAKTASQDKPSTSTDGQPAAAQTSVGCPKPASLVAAHQPLDDGVLAHGPPGAIRFLRLRL
jgi:hypothetical protein